MRTFQLSEHPLVPACDFLLYINAVNDITRYRYLQVLRLFMSTWEQRLSLSSTEKYCLFHDRLGTYFVCPCFSSDTMYMCSLFSTPHWILYAVSILEEKSKIKDNKQWETRGFWRNTHAWRKNKEKKKSEWRYRGSNPRPLACKASALPLSYIPTLGVICE